jgi:hypothetical protein
MNLKKCLIAATVALGAASAPAFAGGVGVSVNIGVPVAPPAVIYEPVPAPPAVGYVWAPGYWGWQSDRYIWIRGRYIYGRPGYAWHPDHWEQRGDRHHFVAGGWEREHGHEHGRGH